MVEEDTVREPQVGRSAARAKWLTLAVVGSGTFMSALDGSIVNIALPAIAQATGSAVSTVEWVALAYLITVSASVFVFGHLSDIYGRRRIYLVGLAVFVAGSLFCGLSGRVGPLILARAVQAVGAAMLFALSPAILVGAFPPDERGRALGLQATMTYLGLVAGPGLGGLLIDAWGWPAIFFVNVPVGLATMWAAGRVLNSDRPAAGQLFDPAGAASLALALGGLLLALSKGGEWGWSHPAIVGLVSAAACCAAAFVAVERRQAHPAIDLGLFRDRGFATSVLASYLCYLASASVGFLMPFLLVWAEGCSASHAGLVMMAVPVAMMLLTGPSGALSDRIGVRLLATSGLVVMAAGVLLLSFVGLGGSSVLRASCLALIGVGTGLFTSPNNSAIMGAAPLERRGVAGAILSATRTVGFATGVAVAGIVYQAGLRASGDGATPQAIEFAVRVGLQLTAVAVLAGAACSAVRGGAGEER